MTAVRFERTYALSDIARKLDRPRTTVKDWAETFREFLPTIGSGRTMRYKEEAIDIFVLIEKMKEANEPNELIRDNLRGMVKEITVTVDDGEPKPLMAGIIESYGVLTEEVRELKDMVQMLSGRIESVVQQQVRNELEQTRQEIATSTDSISQSINKLNEQMNDVQSSLSRVETYSKRKKGLFNRFFG